MYVCECMYVWVHARGCNFTKFGTQIGLLNSKFSSKMDHEGPKGTLKGQQSIPWAVY